MSLPEIPVPVLPCFSILYADNDRLEQCLDGIFAFMGPAVLESGEYKFDMTDYYTEEMGGSLLRKWFCFGLRDPSELAEWKIACIEVEEGFGGEGSRKINVDPGYLDHGKLVLASCKPAPDKIYLARGVYAHKCLRYRSGDFYAPDHSFADFRDGRFNAFLLSARTVYRKLLRERRR